MNLGIREFAWLTEDLVVTGDGKYELGGGGQLSLSFPSSHVQWLHGSNLKWNLKGVFTPGKWTNAKNQISHTPKSGYDIYKNGTSKD